MHADVVGHACRVVRCLGKVPGLEMVLFERGLGAAAVNALRRPPRDGRDGGRPWRGRAREHEHDGARKRRRVREIGRRASHAGSDAAPFRPVRRARPDGALVLAHGGAAPRKRARVETVGRGGSRGESSGALAPQFAPVAESVVVLVQGASSGRRWGVPAGRLRRRRRRPRPRMHLAVGGYDVAAERRESEQPRRGTERRVRPRGSRRDRRARETATAGRRGAALLCAAPTR